MGQDTSANEVETLVLKAARGGGLALGYAEDLAAAVRFLDLDTLTKCPCAGERSDVAVVQCALDRVVSGEGAQKVDADLALIVAMIAASEIAWGKRLIWSETATGAVFERFDDGPADLPTAFGRRAVSDALGDHLRAMAAKLLVPETDASRAAGAGAGLSDND